RPFADDVDTWQAGLARKADKLADTHDLERIQAADYQPARRLGGRWLWAKSVRVHCIRLHDEPVVMHIDCRQRPNLFRNGNHAVGVSQYHAAEQEIIERPVPRAQRTGSM